jgi:DNA-binding MarR family transcriptional regulator
VFSGSLETAIERIERSMVRIRRRQTRRAFASRAPLSTDPNVVGVVDAITSGPHDGIVTVGVVAERLGVDPSQASRLVAKAVQAGAVRRHADQEDGRRSVLTTTTAGRRLLEQVRSHRLRAFEQALVDWTPSDAEQLASLLERFLDALDRQD